MSTATLSNTRRSAKRHPTSSVRPPRYKSAVVIWLAIFPLITAVLALFGPALNALPLVARTFVLTIMLVPIMVYALVPLISWMLNDWLKAE